MLPSAQAVRNVVDDGGDKPEAATLTSRVSVPLKIASFFLLTCYGWLLFRAHSFDRIVAFTADLLGFGPAQASIIQKPTTSALLGMILLAGMQFYDYWTERLEAFLSWPPVFQGLLYAGLIFILIMGTSNAPAQFIYFQF